MKKKNFVNGMRTHDLPDRVSAKDVKKVANERRPNRRVLIETPGGNKTIKDDTKTKIKDGDKLKIVGDRIKGHNFTYYGNKSNFQKQIILDQVKDLEIKLFKDGIELDEDFNWIKVINFRLPEAWSKVNNRNKTDLLLVIPDQFPDLPTDGFYLPKNIQIPPEDTHVFEEGYDGAFDSNEEELAEMKRQGWV